MYISYKGIFHERTEDAPFVGALIAAPSCHLKCKNCFAKDLKKAEIMVDSAYNIIQKVLANPLNQGVIFAGLEWSENPDDLIELIKEAAKQKLEIMIYTGLTFEAFNAIIGKNCADKVGFDSLLSKKMLVENDENLYAIMGASILGYYIPYTYFIKCGKYDKTKIVSENIQFGVKLATANQQIYQIKGEEK